MTDIVQQSSEQKQKSIAQFRQVIDECQQVSNQSKQIETSLKEINKRREQQIKKVGEQSDDSKFKDEVKELELKYGLIKDKGQRNIDTMRDLTEVILGGIKDDIRKTFVHYISLLKNIEYDVNQEVTQFDTEEIQLDDVKQAIDALPMKDIKFELQDVTASALNASKITKPSLTESVINLLGFSNVDIEDEQKESVMWINSRIWMSTL